MPKLVLLDANATLHSSYHALPPLTTSSGQPVGALFGFVKTILKLLREQAPDYLAVCFDSPGPTFRHAEFAAYKATRKEADEALKAQLPRARDLVRAWGLAFTAMEGYEADDLIATLAMRGKENGLDVIIMTSDKDALQLVGGNIRVLNERKGEVMDAAAVEARYGVLPQQMVDYLALVGDASDNVPGVPGIGPGKATLLLRRFKTLDAILKADVGALPKGEARLAQAVQSSRETVLQGRRLITLMAEVPVGLDMESMRVPQSPGSGLLEVLKEFEFASLIPELYSKSVSAAPASLPSEEVDWEALVRDASKGVALSTDGKDLALFAGGKTACLKLGESAGPDRERLSAFLSSGLFVRVHDQKGLIKVLRAQGLDLKGPCFDTMLAGYCLNPSKARYGIEDLALEYLGAALPPRDTAEEFGRRRLAAEASVVAQLADRLDAALRKNLLWELYDGLEMPLVEILADMEIVGIKVDRSALEALRDEFLGRIDKIRSELHAMAGAPVNLNSPKQIGVLLFQKFGLPPQRKIKTGYSTDEEVLRFLSAAHPFPAKLLEYREFSKLQSTYVDALLEQADGQDRVHTQFLQTGTATGRLSSTGPNLQNIPVRTPEGQKVRRVFVAGEGKTLLSADYSQIDLRVLAHLSEDKALCDAFRTGEDIHARTAGEVFHLDPEKVGPVERRLAKAINFGIVYGQTPHGLSQELGITIQQAQDYIQQYMRRYAGVAAWIQRQIESARRESCVQTLLGRVRMLPEIRAKNAAIRAFAERVAVNTPIQGTSADIIKKAMVHVWRGLKEKGWRTRMLLQIHDELLFEVPKEEMQTAAPWIRREMETAVRLKVPVEVGLKSGQNWQDMERLALMPSSED